jgi:hypothetical protein
VIRFGKTFRYFSSLIAKHISVVIEVLFRMIRFMLLLTFNFLLFCSAENSQNDVKCEAQLKFFSESLSRREIWAIERENILTFISMH